MCRNVEELLNRHSNAINPPQTSIGYTQRVMTRKEQGPMAKLHARPSNQYRYEHYDPRVGSEGFEGSNH
jgi:hypothetical protein